MFLVKAVTRHLTAGYEMPPIAQCGAFQLHVFLRKVNSDRSSPRQRLKAGLMFELPFEYNHLEGLINFLN